MKPPAFVPKARDYLRMLVQSWWVILCATALSGLAGWLVYAYGPHHYQANAQLFVLTPGNATTIDAYYGQLNAATRAPTFTGLARSSQVTMRTIEQLGLPETPDALAARITVLPRTQVVLDVAVVGDEPDQTRATAEAVVENMVALAQQLNTVETGDTELVAIDDGAATVQRLESRTTLIAEGAGVGFALSALLVLAYGLIRDKLLARRQVGRLIDEFRAVSDE